MHQADLGTTQSSPTSTVDHSSHLPFPFLHFHNNQTECQQKSIIQIQQSTFKISSSLTKHITKENDNGIISFTTLNLQTDVVINVIGELQLFHK